MQRVNYDVVAPEYDRRYERNRYEGVRRALHGFVGGAAAIAEVGCGTGHWLADLSSGGFDRLVGLDVSSAMLQRAHAVAPNARLVRATASQLPLAGRCLDRVFCINALHHFPDPQAFVRESRRVLRAGGGLLTIGLDPHRGEDQWWIYDFFPAALQADRVRYAPAAKIREWLNAAGFRDVSTDVAEHVRLDVPFEVAGHRGFFDRHSTSQLIVIGDDDYEAGMSRLRRERPALHADLRLYATSAWSGG